MAWFKEKLIAGLDSNKQIWDRLNSDLYDSNPLFDSRFVDNLLVSFGDDRQYLFIHTSDANTIDGMVILTKSNPTKWCLFTTSQAQIAPILIREVRLLNSLFVCLGLPVMQIDLLKQDPCYSSLNAINDEIHILRKKHDLTIGVSIEGYFDSYWSSRNKNLKKNIKRYFNRVNKDFNKVRLAVIDTKSEVRDALRRYSELEVSGWKGKTGTAIQMGTAQEEFYNNMLSEFAEQGNANVYELYFDDELVASRLTVLNHQILIILKTTYKEEYSSYAPGRLLLHMLINREFELDRVSSVELYTNASVDQLSWATHSRYIEHISVFRNEASYISYGLLKNLRDFTKSVLPKKKGSKII